jgi:hypothetical protein
MLLPELGFIQNGSLFKEKAVFSHRIKNRPPDRIKPLLHIKSIIQTIENTTATIIIPIAAAPTRSLLANMIPLPAISGNALECRHA